MSAVSTDTGPFAMVPEWLLFSGVSGNAVKLFATLHRFENAKTEGVYPSRKTLAGLMQVSADTVDRALKELITAGAVTTEARFSEEGDRTSNLYHLHFLRQGSRESAATGSRESAATGSRTDAAVTKEDLNERRLNETPPSEVVRTRAKRAVLTPSERQTLVEEFADLGDVGDRIDAALNHRAVDKCKNEYLYVRNWLRRERQWATERGQRSGKPAKPTPVFPGVTDAYTDAFAVSLWIVRDGKDAWLLEHQEAIAAEAKRRGLSGTEEIMDMINGVVPA